MNSNLITKYIDIHLIFCSLFSIAISADAKPDVKSEYAKTTISGYVQVQFQAIATEKPIKPFSVRRGRFQIKSSLTDRLSTTLEIDANTDEVSGKDLYLRFKLADRFSLKVGQIKKPFSVSQIKAARKLRLIERPHYVRKNFDDYLGRDVGVLAEWKPHKRIDLEFGIFNGNSARDLAGRIELTVIKKHLKIGFNASSHNFSEKLIRRAIGGDLLIRYKNFNILIEELIGDAIEDEKISGSSIAIFHRREIDFAGVIEVEHGGRFEFSGEIDGDKKSYIFAPCVNVYFDRHARLQINPVLRFSDQRETELKLITQTQIEF